MVQFMGKDNVPFHTVIFPSTLIGESGRLRTINVNKGMLADLFPPSFHFPLERNKEERQ